MNCPSFPSMSRMRTCDRDDVQPADSEDDTLYPRSGDQKKQREQVTIPSVHIQGRNDFLLIHRHLGALRTAAQHQSSRPPL